MRNHIPASQPTPAVSAHIMEHRHAARQLVEKAYTALASLQEVANFLSDSGPLLYDPLDLSGDEVEYVRNALGFDHLSTVFETLPAITVEVVGTSPVRGEVLCFTESVERAMFARGKSHEVWAEMDCGPDEMKALFTRFAALGGRWNSPSQKVQDPLPYALRDISA